MLKLNVLTLLEEQGKTKYWLYKQMGMNMSYQNFIKMLNNKTKSIKYDNIELLCRILKCTPNDLFVQGSIQFTKFTTQFLSNLKI